MYEVHILVAGNSGLLRPIAYRVITTPTPLNQSLVVMLPSANHDSSLQAIDLSGKRGVL